MMKKTTAFIFILFACIILLASAVIPHHHHMEQVCLNFKHSHHAGNHSTTFPTDCTHEKDTKNADASCILKQLVVVPTNQIRVEPVFSQIEKLTACFILQPGYSDELLSTELFRKNPLPKDVPIFQSFLDYTQGLRAPPAV